MRDLFMDYALFIGIGIIMILSSLFTIGPIMVAMLRN